MNDGKLKTLGWDAPNAGPSVKIKLWKKGVFTKYYLTGTIANSESYNGTVPMSLTPGTDCKQHLYTPDYAWTDYSDAYFTVN